MNTKHFLSIGLFIAMISCAENNISRIGSEGQEETKPDDRPSLLNASWCDPDENEVIYRRGEHTSAPGLHITEYTKEFRITCFLNGETSHYREYDFPEHPGAYHYPHPDEVYRFKYTRKQHKSYWIRRARRDQAR